MTMSRKKLILFDVDGTLILTGGVAMGLMVEAISRVLGHPIHWTVRDFVGNTDRNIIATLLIRNGATETRLERMVETALQDYLNHLEQSLRDGKGIQILPGVRELLERLDQEASFHLGLVTGNVFRGAQIKLSRDHLFRYFPVGAFGDDAIKREELPPLAIQRAEKHYNCFYRREDIWIVGDSVNDIRCAQAHQLRSLAVATGKIPAEELQQAHPTALVPNLRNTRQIIQILSQNSNQMA